MVMILTVVGGGLAFVWVISGVPFYAAVGGAVVLISAPVLLVAPAKNGHAMGRVRRGLLGLLGAGGAR